MESHTQSATYHIAPRRPITNNASAAHPPGDRHTNNWQLQFEPASTASNHQAPVSAPLRDHQHAPRERATEPQPCRHTLTTPGCRKNWQFATKGQKNVRPADTSEPSMRVPIGTCCNNAPIGIVCCAEGTRTSNGDVCQEPFCRGCCRQERTTTKHT